MFVENIFPCLRKGNKTTNQETVVSGTPATTVSAPGKKPEDSEKKIKYAHWWQRFTGQRISKYWSPEKDKTAETQANTGSASTEAPYKKCPCWAWLFGCKENRTSNQETQSNDDEDEYAELLNLCQEMAQTCHLLPKKNTLNNIVERNSDEDNDVLETSQISVIMEDDDNGHAASLCDSNEDYDVQEATQTSFITEEDGHTDSSWDSDEDDDVQEVMQTSVITEEDGQTASSWDSDEDDDVQEAFFTAVPPEEEQRAEVADSRLSTVPGYGGKRQTDEDLLLASALQLSLLDSSEDFRGPTQTRHTEELVCLGFPNLAQTCYMNSILQGLLTLSSFVQEVHKQERVWGSQRIGEIFRRFVEVGVCHFSASTEEKRVVLTAFKGKVSSEDREFYDNGQKDAHEFLCRVLNIMSSSSKELQTVSLKMAVKFTCPVNAHIAFKMLSFRTCITCGQESMRQEDFTNLSLDVSHKGSVSDSLHEYLREHPLEYRCSCGGRMSAQQWSFLTLPDVLIIQLQRFSFCSRFGLRKVDCAVKISRELVLHPGTAVQQTYSLVSIVSHLGHTAYSGHYICDGVDRQRQPGDTTDRWLSYDDMHVSETSFESVCSQRKRSAYILFYEKQV